MTKLKWLYFLRFFFLFVVYMAAVGKVAYLIATEVGTIHLAWFLPIVLITFLMCLFIGVDFTIDKGDKK